MSPESTRHQSRRTLLTAGGVAVFASPFFAVRGLFADQLAATPALTEGPFYPDHLPLDQDNDLILIDDNVTPAIGEVTHFGGKILTPAGSPVRNALVEIWQCDANGVYLHSRDSVPNKARQDANFQGYGKFETAADGAYRFRTIKPVPYWGRPAPHIHVKVSVGGQEVLTTQCLIRGFEANDRDGVFRRVTDPQDRRRLTTEFKPMPGSTIGELAANFDVVLGQTPADRT